MSDTTGAAVYYDPCDVEIDDDPYPVWKRLRDEAPLYRNDEHGFYALSRWDDVEPALLDWRTYRSGRGTIFEIIKADVEIPPGIILFEDPPIHDLHRGVLSRVFTPRRMAAVEPLVRDFCAKALDPLAGAGELDVIADLGVLVPMRTIGYLLGIPEEAQRTIRDFSDDNLELRDGAPAEFDARSFDDANALVAEYIDWRAAHPSDDLMTELLNAEVEEDGVRRRLTRTEVLTYTNMVAGAGNETGTRLIGFAMQLLADHPAQREAIVGDPGLIPAAIEEVLRFEAPSPVQARHVARDVEVHGRTVPEGSIMLLLNGAANRDERRFEDAGRFDVHRTARSHLAFGYGPHFCLGASLARLEGRVALEEFLKRWPAWEVDHDRAAKAHTASVRGWERLPVRVR
ncbi:cytochrome P450 [Actinomadura rugatobispora]|uniref:Cytochrome P450 n=1 Tax=Actinomadura rugatobispora TaxID=1994 RepID=A0ABW0ZY28_9ACTN